MNKKFSTFVASLLLAGAVGTASAAISDKGAMSSYPVAIAKAIDGKFYQLSDGYQVLTMEKTAKGTYVLKFVPYGQAELAKTLWEIKATDSKDEKDWLSNSITYLPACQSQSMCQKQMLAKT